MEKLFLLALLAVSCSGDEYHPDFRKYDRPREDITEDKAYWEEKGYDDLLSSLEATSKIVPDHAKNVIIFVGDGMSIPTITAARIYKAQYHPADGQQGNFVDPESQYLTFEQLDHLGFSKTYAVDKQTVDSAASASAMFSGIKTKYGTLGFDSHIERGYPETMDPSIEVTTIMTDAQEVGMATGVVTTARLTHATPAGTYAHTFDRNWECDAEFDDNNVSGADKPDDYNDIAWQLINQAPGMNFKVQIGGGYPAFFPASMADDLNSTYGPYLEDWDCYRLDEVDLTQQWLDQKRATGESAEFVMDKSQLDAIDISTTDNLFGLFAQGHMEYDHNRVEGRDPELSELVEAAITILRKNDQGFVLLVEGGRIDHAHHDVQARTALDEVVAMDKAVETAMSVLGDDLDDTLIIVTADHAHTMSIAGYPSRGNSIIDLSGDTYEDIGGGLPYTTLSYANGLAYYYHNIPDTESDRHITRRDLSGEPVTDFGFEYTSAGYRYSETHGGDDVAIFSQGPGSMLFHRAHEQSHIYQVMAYAICAGDYLGYTPGDEICDLRSSASTGGTSSGTTMPTTAGTGGSTDGGSTGSAGSTGSTDSTTPAPDATTDSATSSAISTVLFLLMSLAARLA